MKNCSADIPYCSAGHQYHVCCNSNGYRTLDMGGSIKGTLSCDTPTGNTATTMKPTKFQMGDRIGACRGLTGQSEENRHLEDQGVDGKRTLK